MVPTQIFYSLLSTILVFLLIQFTGIFMALARWKRHPEVSFLAIIATIVIISDRIVAYLLSPFMLPSPFMLFSLGNYIPFNFIIILMFYIAHAFGLMAIFGWRNVEVKTMPREKVPTWVLLSSIGSIILIFITSVALAYMVLNRSLFIPNTPYLPILDSHLIVPLGVHVVSFASQLNFFIMLGLIFILASPYFLVQSAGIVIAAVRWKRHPAVSLLVFIIVLLGSVLYCLPSLIQWIYSRNHLLGLYLFNHIYIIEELLPPILGVLTLAAIFGWRNGKVKTALKGTISFKVLLLTASALILFFLDLLIGSPIFASLGYPPIILNSILRLSPWGIDFRIFALIEILMFAAGSVFLLIAMNEQGKGKLKEVIHAVIKSRSAYIRTTLKDLLKR